MVGEIWGGIKKKNATSTIFLQHFHNKSQVISYYQFKFKFNAEIIFFNPTITTWHLKICCKNCVHVPFLKKKWNGFVAMALPKQKKKICDKLIVAMSLPKQGEKKNNGCRNLGRN